MACNTQKARERLDHIENCAVCSDDGAWCIVYLRMTGFTGPHWPGIPEWEPLNLPLEK